jgi:ribokinase
MFEEKVKPKILTIGALAMDIVIEAPILPKDDEFALIGSEKLVPGGSSSNVSVALSKMGIEVFQTGQIGDDKFGHVFENDLLKNGVNTKYLIKKENGTTLHTYIMTATKGKHCIFANLGDSVNTLSKESLEEDILDGCTCFYADMYSPDATLWIAEKARKRNIPVVFNMQNVPSFLKACGIEESALNKMLSLCTLFIAGKNVYKELTGQDSIKLGMQELANKFNVRDGVICTAGKNGAYWLYENKLLNQESFAIEPVDTTGAGDCFSAGIIFDFYCRMNSKQNALVFASAIASLKCGIKGPRFKSNLNEIEKFIKNNK